MAADNSFYIPETVAKVAIGILGPDMVLAGMCNKDYASEFRAGVGYSVNVKRPITLAANTRAMDANAAITVDGITQPAVETVAIDANIYSAVQLSDEDLTLNIEDFSAQVLAPQTASVARGIESKVLAGMQAVAEGATGAALGAAYSDADPLPTFTAARKALRDLGVPAGSLKAAVGTQIAADLINSGKLTDASQSGSVGALRDATIGRLRGFDVVEVNTLADNEAIFFHPDAFTLVLRAPVVPSGVSFGASVSANGFAVRYIRDYDSDLLSDRSVLNVFAGFKAMKKDVVALNGTVTQAVPAIRTILDGAA